MTAPVKYLGYQQGFGTVKAAYLYNLTEDIPGHPVGSTLCEETLMALGYEIPRNEQVCTECNGTLGRHDRGCKWPL